MSAEGNREEIAITNQQIFAISRKELMSLDSNQLLAFLEAAIRVFARKLRGSGKPFLFYTWFDEISGTLRLSATRGSEWHDLPFTCRLEVCKEPGDVVVDFLAGDTIDGIPMSTLEAVELGDAKDDNIEFVQRVFSRPLPRLAS